MASTESQCKLCGQAGQLCRSHIVPGLAYEPVKNEKGQILAVGRNVKKVQTGHFERLLCPQCENLLSAHESRFKQVWMNTIPPNFSHLSTEPPNNVIRVEVPDYDSFKLFHLSVLWRAAASSTFKLESDITLGPYDQQIASMLLNNDPGQPGDFPFLATVNLDRKKRPVATVSPLAKGTGRFEGRYHYYLMSYAYCDWMFIVAQPGPQWLAEFERECRNERMFLLHAVPHTQSKSFTLWGSILRQLRRST